LSLTWAIEVGGCLLGSFDGRKIGARHGGGERLPGEFIVSFECATFSLSGRFFRANTTPYVASHDADADTIDPALG
jgi:hypothetical protein